MEQGTVIEAKAGELVRILRHMHPYCVVMKMECACGQALKPIYIYFDEKAYHKALEEIIGDEERMGEVVFYYLSMAVEDIIGINIRCEDCDKCVEAILAVLSFDCS